MARKRVIERLSRSANR